MASPNLPVPRYHRVYLVLREQLRAGEFQGEQPMPGELELAGRFGVSRVTVRSALDKLVEEGLIERHRGRGTFARPRSELTGAPADERPRLSGLLENVVAAGLKTQVKVIDIARIAAPPEVCLALRLALDAPVQRAVRVRSYEGAPVSHITTYVPAPLASALGAKELGAKPMLKLLEESGVAVASAEQTISARLADAAVAPLLEVEVGTALLAVTRTVHDDTGRPVQLLHGLYRPDRYEYRMHLERSGGAEPRVWVHQASEEKK